LPRINMLFVRLGATMLTTAVPVLAALVKT
jgi:hypothetical protein